MDWGNLLYLVGASTAKLRIHMFFLGNWGDPMTRVKSLCLIKDQYGAWLNFIALKEGCI